MKTCGLLVLLIVVAPALLLGAAWTGKRQERREIKQWQTGEGRDCGC
jgi:hypothetical protein